MPAKYLPGESIRHGIPSIMMDPPLHEFSIALGEKAFLVSFVGKIDDDKPCRNCDDLNGQTLDDLLQVRQDQLTHLRPGILTKIHCQPLRPPRPSILIKPYAKMFEKPPTLTENK